jgi:hypothetical protein
VSSHKEALEERAKERRAAALRVMEHMLAGSDEATARSALLSWHVAAMRQVCLCRAGQQLPSQWSGIDGG